MGGSLAAVVAVALLRAVAGARLPLERSPLSRALQHVDDDVLAAEDEDTDPGDAEHDADVGAISLDWVAPVVDGTDRTLLLTLCPTYHGSTALEQIIMSGHEVATLCPAETWQCEGDNILCNQEPQDSEPWPMRPTAECSYPFAFLKRQIDDTHHNVTNPLYIWNYTAVLEEFSNIWNLSHPILFEKTPDNWKHIYSMIDGYLAAILPPAMTAMGIHSLHVETIIMWRPWCMYNISSHALERIELLGYEEFMHFEHGMNMRLAWRHAALTHKKHIRTLVVSYADLLWETQLTIERIESFMPQLGKLDEDYVPTIGVEIFEGNSWKPQGSVVEFGVENPPQPLGYDMELRTCINTGDRAQLLSVSAQRQTDIETAYETLTKLSREDVPSWDELVREGGGTTRLSASAPSYTSTGA